MKKAKAEKDISQVCEVVFDSVAKEWVVAYKTKPDDIIYSVISYSASIQGLGNMADGIKNWTWKSCRGIYEIGGKK